ncbi:MAG: hypothetical protein ACP5TF_00065 [Candidatus Acidifodinimicrobium sp.]
MINNITSIENSLNNISVIIGRGTAIKTHIEESKAPPQLKPEPVEEKEVKTTTQKTDEEGLDTKFEYDEKQNKTSEDLKKEIEKLESIAVTPSKSTSKNEGDATEPPNQEVYKLETKTKINPNLGKELNELESKFSRKIKNPKEAQPTEEKEVEIEPQSTGTINPMEALVELINEKKSISVSDAAKALNFDTSLVETWAKLLNDNNKIKIEYRLVGNPILKVK